MSALRRQPRKRLGKVQNPDQPEVKRFRLSRPAIIWVNDMPEPSAILYRGESDDAGNITQLILKRHPGQPPVKKVALYQGDDFFNCKVTQRLSDNHKGQKVKIRPGHANHGERPEYVPEAEIDLSQELQDV